MLAGTIKWTGSGTYNLKQVKSFSFNFRKGVYLWRTLPVCKRLWNKPHLTTDFGTELVNLL